MSDDNKLPLDCFWVQNGKCFLYQMDETWVFDFLSRIPKARRDLLSCAKENTCPCVDEDFVSFAKKGITITDAKENSDKFQKLANRFIDRHRQIQKGQVYRQPPDNSDDNDDN